MRIYKRIAALVFMLVLLLSCFPAAVFASGEQGVTEPESTAAPTDAPPEPDETASSATEPPATESPLAANAPAPRIGGSIGGSTGDASIGGTKPGSGSLAYMAPGVTMQVIYFRYKDVYDKQTTYDKVVAGADSPVKTYKAMNSAGETVDTVLNGTSVSNYTVFGDLNNGYAYELPPISGGVVPNFTQDWIRKNCVRVGDGEIEAFFQRVIFGNDYGAWDKTSVGTDTALYTKLLRYLGVEEGFVTNYLDSYNDRLSPTDPIDGEKLIPTIIWSYIVLEKYGTSTGYVYTPSMIYNPYQGTRPFDDFWKLTFGDETKSVTGILTSYTPSTGGTSVSYWSGDVHAAAYDYLMNSGSRHGCQNKGDSYICGGMFGKHGGWPPHYAASSPYPYVGTGLVNRIPADGPDQGSTGSFYFFRNYWSPFGQKLPPKTAPVSLQKGISAPQACIDTLVGNAMYSLAGAEYTVSAGGAVTETLVTDAAGRAVSAQEYQIGTVLTIRETKAPPGFLLDPAVHTHTVTAGSNEITLADIPLFDPPFILTKRDAATGTAQGDMRFQGAVFLWEYFDNTACGGTAKRSWHFAADENGNIQYHPDFLAAGYGGDALYTAPDGSFQLPLGALRITEIKSVPGYAVLPVPLICQIVEDAASPIGVTVRWMEESLRWLLDIAEGNWGVIEPPDTATFGSISIEKGDAQTGSTPQGGASLAGAVFAVINRSAHPVKVGDNPVAAPGEVCCELTTDENGRAVSGAVFPIGSYSVREVKAPDGYTLNTEWEQSFRVTEENSSFSFTLADGNGCTDIPIRGGIRVVKRVSGGTSGSDAMLDGITFSVYSENAQPVVVGGKTYQKGDAVLTLQIAWDGSCWKAETPTDALPYGTYTVREDPLAENSGLANRYYLLNKEGQTVTVGENGAVLELVFENALRPGKIAIQKTDLLGKPLPGAVFLLEWSQDGQNWQAVTHTESDTVPGGCTSPELTDGCLTSGISGSVIFTGLDPRLYYRLTEVKAPDGYSLLTGYAFEGMLPEEDVTVSLRVVNAPVFELPKTGSTGLRALGIFVAIFSAASAALLVAIMLSHGEWKKNKKQ